MNNQFKIQTTRQETPVWPYSFLFCAIFFGYASLLFFGSYINNPTMINADFIIWSICWFVFWAVLLFFLGIGTIIVYKIRIKKEENLNE